VQLATDAEAAAMASASRALTPSNLLAIQAHATGGMGIVRYASPAEAVNGGVTYAAMSPARVHTYAMTYLASWFNRTLHVSGAGPSGGNEGDIWMQIV
jgi:hypothetical protein